MDHQDHDFDKNVYVLLNSCGLFIVFLLESGKTWFLHRHCCLVPETWSTVVRQNVNPSFAMSEQIKGPFIVVRDFPTRRGSPSSYSNNGNGGDFEAGQSTNNNNNNNGNGEQGTAWIFAELELAVEANPPYIIVDSAFADEVSKNIYRGNLLKVFSVFGSVSAAALAVSVKSLPISVPVLSMTVATAGFYGIFYMNDPAMKYVVVGRKWRTNGFQLSPEHFLYTEQAPLVLKAANSRFRKVLRVIPTILPLVGVGVVAWRFWKVLA